MYKLTARLTYLAKAYKDETWQSFESKLNVEKELWQGIGDDLLQMELLKDEKVQEFKNKIKDVCDVNGFVTALQWLGCVLVSLVTVGGLLFWDKVRNRISHPKITRQYYRFQDNKNELLNKISLLQKNNNKEINSYFQDNQNKLLSKIAPLQDNNQKIENDM